MVLDPATDFDGDGQSNGAEFTAGTHPLQGSSVLKITQINILGGDVNLTLSTVAGKNYQLETKLTLDPGPWANVGTPVGASGPSTAFTHPGGAGDLKRFYRARVVP